MKKIISLIISTYFIVSILSGCGTHVQTTAEYRSQESTSMFVEIENVVNFDGGWIVVYHKHTKVMYVISRGDYNKGNFTLLVNPDGSPMIYGEDYIG